MEDFLRSLAPFKKEEIVNILSFGKTKKASKGETMFPSGKPFTNLWFVEEGLIRSFRIINGEDYTFFFFTKKEFAVDYQSYLLGNESPLIFEALADTEYVEFSKESMYKLYETIPLLEKVGRLMAEQAYLSATERLKQFQAEPLQVRYQKLLDRDPKLFQQIPQYHIASYLGVKPQSLSRVRAGLAGKKYWK